MKKILVLAGAAMIAASGLVADQKPATSGTPTAAVASKPMAKAKKVKKTKKVKKVAAKKPAGTASKTPGTK